MREETIFVVSNEEDAVVEEIVREKEKAQEVTGKSKKNVEKIKKKFEKEIKIDKIQEVKITESEVKVKEELKQEVIKEDDNLDEIKIEETIQHIKEVVKEVVKEVEKEVVKEVSTDLSLNTILLDFSNNSVREILSYMRQKYDDKENIDIENYCRKINCVLTRNDMSIINILLAKNPTLLYDIEKSAMNIIKNNTIEPKNVPELFLIVQILYTGVLTISKTQFENNTRSAFCGTLIKFVFHSLIERNKNAENETQISSDLLHLDQLIDTSISLLNFKSIIKPKACCSIM